MTTLREAAQAVLDRWDSPRWDWYKNGPTANLMADLRAQLEQPEQEPLAWWHKKSDTFTGGSLISHFTEWIPLYTTPPQRKPLSEDMVHRAMLALNTASGGELEPTVDEMRAALEAAHGIK